MDESKIETTINAMIVPDTLSLKKKIDQEIVQRSRTVVKDIGARNRQLANLKPMECTRTPEMIEAMVLRLVDGESLLSVCTDPEMPRHATVMLWMRNDPELRSLITWARTEGTHVLFDPMQDIAQKGHFSTNDDVRDAMLISVIQLVVWKRNRADFGDKVEITSNSINYTVKKSDTDW